LIDAAVLDFVRSIRTEEPAPLWQTFARSERAVKEESSRFGWKLLEGVIAQGMLAAMREWGLVMPPASSSRKPQPG